MAYSALLDGCVLFPASLRDTLLRIAETGMYRPRWSAEILDEVRRNLAERYPDITPSKLDSLIEAMGEAFEDASVEGYESLVDSMTNDAKDRHVLAAAVVGRCDVIVTSNIKHFPPEACNPLGVDVQTPDEFLVHAFHLDPDLIVEVLEMQAADKQSPPMDLNDLLEALTRTAPTFVAQVRELVG